MASPPEGPPEGSSESRRRRLLVPVLAGALVLTTALALVFALLWRDAAEGGSEQVSSYLGEQRPAAEKTAARVIELLMNYDATNLEERAVRIRELATGSFREQYEDLVSQGLPAALEEASASSRGQILEGPDVSFAGPAEAIAVARVTQTTQSTENPSGKTFEYVLRISLVEAEGQGWKAAGVEILSERST